MRHAQKPNFYRIYWISYQIVKCGNSDQSISQVGSDFLLEDLRDIDKVHAGENTVKKNLIPFLTGTQKIKIYEDP